jgi:hypothetical protein
MQSQNILVLHTGNRIDAVLDSQVFRHLLRLPLSDGNWGERHRAIGWAEAADCHRQSATEAAEDSHIRNIKFTNNKLLKFPPFVNTKFIA